MMMSAVVVVTTLLLAASCRADICTDLQAKVTNIETQLNKLNDIQDIISLMARERLEKSVKDKFTLMNQCASGVPSTSLPLGDVSGIPDGVSGPAKCSHYCQVLNGCVGFNYRSPALTDDTQCQLYTTTQTLLATSSGCQYYMAVVGYQLTPCAVLANVALRKEVWGSATYSTQTIPALAVDGNKAATENYCSISASGGSNWLAVDLGQLTLVRFVNLTSRSDGYSSQTGSVTVGLTNTAPTVLPTTSNVIVCGYGPAVVALGATIKVNCVSGLNPARYVAILKTTTDHLSICELEVWGYQ